jgi:heme-degrading monooxygenase HmoA
MAGSPVVGSPVRVTLTMVVDNGNVGEFSTRLARIADYAVTEPGCLGQAITTRDLPDQGGTEFVVTSDWADLATFRRFETSPEQGRLTAPLAALRRTGRMDLAELAVAEPAHPEGRTT